MDTGIRIHHTVARVVVHARGSGVMMRVRIDRGAIADDHPSQTGSLELTREQSTHAIHLFAIIRGQPPVQLRERKSEWITPPPQNDAVVRRRALLHVQQHAKTVESAARRWMARPTMTARWQPPPQLAR